MKAQPSVQTTSTTPAHAPPTATAGAYAAPAANAHVDHVPRALRWLQSFLAGVIAALSIAANVGFHNLLARDDLVGGDGYVAALVIPVVVVRCPPSLFPSSPLPQPILTLSPFPSSPLPPHLARLPSTLPIPARSTAPRRNRSH